MWIVRLALRRPYTFIVMAILIAILGGTAIVTMPVDIFPYIDIPIVSVLWYYPGLAPDEMEKRVVTGFERSLTTNVNDIEHLESQSYSGVAVIRVYFHPNVTVDMAMSQVTATMQTAIRNMPAGMFPANILKYDAASVPVLQLGLSSPTLREQEIFDYGANFIRTGLGTVQGASVSWPFGGKNRSVMVDLDLNELYGKQLSPIDVSNALNLQNLILPAGTAKIADTEYSVKVNSSPLLLADLNNLPIKTVNGATVYMKDVAQVHDGFTPQLNIVRTNGKRGVLMTVTRNGKTSTLDIVNGVKKALPRIMANLPQDLKVTAIGDQSVFVRASIQGVLREALIAAALTGLMILLFLGSWRSTLIVCISIPLSILTSLFIMSLLGQTINVMTLGGLALAVGILVDDATVEIENTHRNIAMRKPLARAVLDGASQIAIPTFVSTLSICIVFIPVLLLTGTARYLFTPLAMAVVFAMAASYLLSRTLIPTMVHYLLRSEVDLYEHGVEGEPAGAKGILWRLHYIFNSVFESLRFRYMGLLHWSLQHRALVLSLFMVISEVRLALYGSSVRTSFQRGSGSNPVACRGPVGTRSKKPRPFSEVEREPEMRSARRNRHIVDEHRRAAGLASLAQGDMPDLQKRRRRNTDIAEQRKAAGLQLRPPYEAMLRKGDLHDRSRTSCSLPTGKHHDADFFELRIRTRRRPPGRWPRRCSGLPHRGRGRIRLLGFRPVDVHAAIRFDNPESADVDRVQAAQLGSTERDVTSNMLISLSGSSSVARVLAQLGERRELQHRSADASTPG